jgi:lipopolysaccharide export system permease protein
MAKWIKTKSYITTHFTKSFLTVFLPFFLIISLIYLVKISALTAQIQISFQELLLLFSYSVPDIIYYTLPLSFIVALSSVLIRLSSENELIALYALGFDAGKIVRSLFWISLLFSLFLLVVSLIAMPTSKQLYKSFKEEKKADAQLNIVPGKLGQKFGNYYIYVKSNDNGIYKNLVIYNRSDLENEQFFASRYGQMRKHGRKGALFLIDGYGYTYGKNSLQQAKYTTLEVFDRVKNKPFHFQDIVAYWGQAPHNKKIEHRLLFFLFISLIPLLSVYLIAAYSMINPRYQSGHMFAVAFFTALLLYLIGSSLEKWGNFYLLAGAVILVFSTGYYLFKKRVARYF